MTDMVERVDRFGLQVAAELAEFIEARALPGTGVEVDAFWRGLSDLVDGLTPENRALLDRRAALQEQIDAWHIERRGQSHNRDAYQAFLREIGYLLPEGPDFEIETANVDPEIARIPGPQLVVPITNARYALNAANARWGSLYDALYGTDAMGPLPATPEYDRGRGARVVARTRVFLDEAFPIAGLSHADARRYHVRDGALLVNDLPLEQPDKFAGYRGDPRAPDAVLLVNNGLHVALVFDRAHPIGARDQACLADVRLESAISAIMDCEDSVACVDAADKVLAYDNWLGLMKGDLAAEVSKSGATFTRSLNPDETYTAPDGSEISVRSRALMLVRNVGHLMTNPAILDQGGDEVFEGLMDAAITTLIAMHDLGRDGGNSQAGSVYVVKPKMHGPDEVAFAVRTFDMVEDILGLARLRRDDPRHPAGDLPQVVESADHRRGREQRARHPRLRGALDRPGHRLFESAGCARRRPDGRPRHLQDLGPAHRQLVASGRGERGRGDDGDEENGRRGGRAERGRSALSPDGAGIRRDRVPRGLRSGVRRPGSAVRLHRADPARPPSRAEGRTWHLARAARRRAQHHSRGEPHGHFTRPGPHDHQIGHRQGA